MTTAARPPKHTVSIWVFLPAVCLLTTLSSAYNSIYSIGGMGLELSPYSPYELAMGNAGMAFVHPYGTSIQNPSKTGFNQKTVFESAFSSDLIYVQDGFTSNTLSGSRIPFIGMNFQAGIFGNLGLYYFQRFEKSFSFEPDPVPGVQTEQVEYLGGAYEVLISLAKAANRNFSGAVSYNFIWGKDQQISSTQFNRSEFRDIEGDTLVHRWSGGYPSVSATYKTKKFSTAFSASVPLEIERRTQRKIFSQSSNPSQTRVFSLPLSVSLGFHYSMAEHQNWVFDISTSDWDGSIGTNINRSFRAGGGFEYQGLGSQYDSYYKKIAWRGGMAYERLYIFNTDDLKLTGGLGLPLGVRGSNMNLSLELGRRDFFALHQVQENYFKISVSFIGSGVWGRPSRRQ